MGGDLEMRIGIDARFLTHPQNGGFKTYTENLVQGLSALDRENDYILYTDRPGAEEAWTSDNFRVNAVGGPAPVREQVLLPVVMLRDRLDLAHFPCNTGPVVKPCRTVLTVHDLIPCMPCLNRGREMSLKQRTLFGYWGRVMPIAARRAERVITISQSSKSDIRRMLNVPDRKISIVPTGLHADFHPVTDNEEIERVRLRYRLPHRFILGFVSSDARKNSRRLLGAVGKVAARLKDIGLVMICASPEARRMVEDFARDQDFRSSLLSVLEGVPRRDLVALYSMAETLVFPSLYEGLGLPVIEAMACGLPVVTSDVSSLPEVAGNAALLVDPTDVDAIAGASCRVITDQVLRERLVKKGAERAAEFNWRRTVQETIAVYANVFAGAKSSTMVETAGGRTG